MQKSGSLTPHSSLLTKFIWAGILLLLLLAGARLMTASDKNSKHFTIIESGAWTEGDVGSTVGWLSNDEIIFKGSENITSSPSTGKPFTHTVSIWKIGTGITIYKRNIGNFCFQHKNLSYSTEAPPPKNYATFYGPFGKEEPINSLVISQRTCQSRAEYPDFNRDITPLLPEHGVLDGGLRTGSITQSPSVIFYKKGDSEGITLPFSQKEMADVKYYPYKQAYLINLYHLDPKTTVPGGDWPADSPRPLWWLTPDGKITKFNIAPPWNQSTRFYPTVAGIVVAGYDERLKKPTWRDIGLFLIKPDGSVEKIVSGYARNVTISPDGCAAAFSHTETMPWTADSVRLKVVQFCK